MIYTYYGKAKEERNDGKDSKGNCYPKKPKSLFIKDSTNIFYKFTYGTVLRSIKLFKNKKYFITLDKIGRIQSIKSL